MKKLAYLILILALTYSACKPEPPKPEDGEPILTTQLSMDVSVTFEGELLNIFQDYENVNGYQMSFEDARLYLSEISLIKTGGEEVALSTIEYFDFDGEEISRVYDVTPGDYEGIVYHIGVPQSLNGTDDPDFMVSQYGTESPLNVQNGMYWGWNPGYKFLIYEGRIDGTPDDTSDLPSVFSIHLGKDQFYTEMLVDLPFSISEGQTKHFNIEWDFAKNQYNDSDMIDLTLFEESAYHGSQLDFAARFQALMQDAFIHSLD